MTTWHGSGGLENESVYCRLWLQDSHLPSHLSQVLGRTTEHDDLCGSHFGGQVVHPWRGNIKLKTSRSGVVLRVTLEKVHFLLQMLANASPHANPELWKTKMRQRLCPLEPKICRKNSALSRWLSAACCRQGTLETHCNLVLLGWKPS